jgi:hypothetical protein
MLKQFLTENHTDGNGAIEVSDSIEVLKLTAEIIKSDSEIDFECMVSELLESDEIRKFCESVILQDIAEAIQDTTTCDDKAESILNETIDRILRTG